MKFTFIAHKLPSTVYLAVVVFDAMGQGAGNKEDWRLMRVKRPTECAISGETMPADTMMYAPPGYRSYRDQRISKEGMAILERAPHRRMFHHGYKRS